MITLAIFAFMFIVGTIVVILAIASEGLVIFPFLGILVIVLIIATIVKLFSK